MKKSGLSRVPSEGLEREAAETTCRESAVTPWTSRTVQRSALPRERKLQARDSELGPQLLLKRLHRLTHNQGSAIASAITQTDGYGLVGGGYGGYLDLCVGWTSEEGRNDWVRCAAAR